jgi:hypothetical protein
VEAIPTLLYGIEVSYYSLIVCGLEDIVDVYATNALFHRNFQKSLNFPKTTHQDKE